MPLASDAWLSMIARNPHPEAWDTWLKLVDSGQLAWSGQELLRVLRFWEVHQWPLTWGTADRQLAKDMAVNLLDRTLVQPSDMQQIWTLAMGPCVTPLRLHDVLTAHPAWPPIETVSGWRLPLLENDRRPARLRPHHLVHDLLDRAETRVCESLIQKGLVLPDDALNWATPESFAMLIEAGAQPQRDTLQFWSDRHSQNRMSMQAWQDLQGLLKSHAPQDRHQEKKVLVHGLTRLLRERLPSSEEIKSNLKQLDQLGFKPLTTTVPMALPMGGEEEIPIIGALALEKLRHHESGQGSKRLFAICHELVQNLDFETSGLDPCRRFGETDLISLLRLACVSMPGDSRSEALLDRLSAWHPESDQKVYFRLLRTQAWLKNDRSSDRRKAVHVQSIQGIRRLFSFRDNDALVCGKPLCLEPGFLLELLTTPSALQGDVWEIFEKSFAYDQKTEELMGDWLDRPQIVTSFYGNVAGALRLSGVASVESQKKLIQRLSVFPADLIPDLSQWDASHDWSPLWVEFQKRYPKIAQELSDRRLTHQRALSLSGVASLAPEALGRRRLRG